MKAREASQALHALANSEKATLLQRFFKTGKGQYAEGDRFLGVMAPEMRRLTKQFEDLSLSETARLLRSPFNEERLLALFILGQQYEKGTVSDQNAICRLYLKNLNRVNNWNLVDASAPSILGPHLMNRSRTPLYRLAKSKDLWKRRVAVVSTLHAIRNHDFSDILKLSVLLLEDEHDLMHKACGWMLREVGKRDVKTLERFLKKYRHRMPRTMLRYAIERFPEKQRKAYLA
ncbi:DNA alkylation repair protein [Bdellovibrionota bacterium FG-1]